MTPTIQWIKEKFSYFNSRYFNNQLPTPYFSLDCPDGFCGYYDIMVHYSKITRRVDYCTSNGTIRISTSVPMNERELCGTLIHEMIHEYIYLVKKKIPFNDHGKDFLKEANRIEIDGWPIR